MIKKYGFAEWAHARLLGGLVGSLVFFCTISNSFANWEKHEIDGAVCGDGTPYSVFVRPGRSDLIAVDLMGGGACWNSTTCFGPTPMAWIHQLPFPIEPGGFLSEDPELNPLAEATLVYFPYCTGDVHIGTHVANYAFGQVHHVGRNNFRLAIAQWAQEKWFEMSRVRRVVLAGSSAGAIGALVNLGEFDRWLTEQLGARARNVQKFLIADSPGLHFGDHFWDKFSDQMQLDFKAGLNEIGAGLGEHSGLMARPVVELAKHYPGWRFSILQGSRDFVMSSMFGTISPVEHEKLVYGPDGIFQLSLDRSDRFAAWVPQTYGHAFMVSDFARYFKTSDGLDGFEFLRDEFSSRSGQSHR